MGLDTTGAAPAGNTLLVSGTGKLARADDPFFTGVSDQLGGQGASWLPLRTISSPGRALDR
jgi:hypothetical protein